MDFDPANPFDVYALLWLSLLSQWQDDAGRPWRVRTLVREMDRVQVEALKGMPPRDARVAWEIFTDALPGWVSFWSSSRSWKRLSGGGQKTVE